jgi:hypothetical protein
MDWIQFAGILLGIFAGILIKDIVFLFPIFDLLFGFSIRIMLALLSHLRQFLCF